MQRIRGCRREAHGLVDGNWSLLGRIVYLGSGWAKFFEWWAGCSSGARYGVAFSVLGISALAWFVFGYITFVGWGAGLILLIAAGLIRD